MSSLCQSISMFLARKCLPCVHTNARILLHCDLLRREGIRGVGGRGTSSLARKRVTIRKGNLFDVRVHNTKLQHTLFREKTSIQISALHKPMK